MKYHEKNTKTCIILLIVEVTWVNSRIQTSQLKKDTYMYKDMQSKCANSIFANILEREYFVMENSDFRINFFFLS
jgi:hypothetical protein